jgi:hypothetical protein
MHPLQVTYAKKVAEGDVKKADKDERKLAHLAGRLTRQSRWEDKIDRMDPMPSPKVVPPKAGFPSAAVAKKRPVPPSYPPVQADVPVAKKRPVPPNYAPPGMHDDDEEIVVKYGVGAPKKAGAYTTGNAPGCITLADG